MAVVDGPFLLRGVASADRLAEKSDSTMRIEIYPSEQLGVALLLVTYMPEISLWIPSLFGY